jgi:hypothetical protein
MWMFENILIEVEGASCEMKWQYVIILRNSPCKFLIILIILNLGIQKMYTKVNHSRR